MSEEWWAEEAEVEAVPGPPAVRQPREMSEVEKYRLPSKVNATWAKSQLTKKDWADNRSQINPFLIESMCRDASKGLSKRAIMARAGLAITTWSAWERKASEGLEPYSLWYRCMMLSISSVEDELIDNVRMAGQTDWKASKWLLEQINKDEYGPTPKNQVVNINGDVSAEASVNYVSESDAMSIARIMQTIGALPQIDNVVEGEVVDESNDSDEAGS